MTEIKPDKKPKVEQVVLSEASSQRINGWLAQVKSLELSRKEIVNWLIEKHSENRRFLASHPKIGEDREKYRWAIDNYLRKAAKRLSSSSLDLEIDLGELDNIPDLDQNRKYKAVHMLRAGHAIHMMAKTRDNSAFVAKQLGDTEQVVREHYAGRTNRPLSIAEVAASLSAA